MNVTRLHDLVRKGWGYTVALIEHPTRAPANLVAVSRGAHLGERLTLSERRAWLAASEIRTVLDVGAHTGQFSSALRTFLPDARIYAFEPIPDCHRRLVARFSNDARFEAFNTALGETDGEIPFHTSSFPKASSPLAMTALHEEAFPWSAETDSWMVSVRTMDSFLEELDLDPKVLLKVDVQGYEAHVLRGGQELLGRTAYVLVETSFAPLYEGQADFHTVYSHLVDLGFVYAGSWDQLTSPVDQSILQADALFVRAQ